MTTTDTVLTVPTQGWCALSVFHGRNQANGADRAQPVSAGQT
jgi:hypothetical protein